MSATPLTLAAATLPAAFVANFGDRFELIGFRPMTAVAADSYLFVVIARRADGTFAKWTYNATAGGFGSGHYDLELRRALELMIEPTYSLRPAVTS
ncbi:hypothetical protein LCGC14_0567780 [marine sediment metagenome]|uniref:Uncharacterized protein n=1 Tax=marine sediment metagenome TaxID=412755 RepID=A0A0F9UTA6_9ZZZZ